MRGPVRRMWCCALWAARMAARVADWSLAGRSSRGRGSRHGSRLGPRLAARALSRRTRLNRPGSPVRARALTKSRDKSDLRLSTVVPSVRLVSSLLFVSCRHTRRARSISGAEYSLCKAQAHPCSSGNRSLTPRRREPHSRMHGVYMYLPPEVGLCRETTMLHCATQPCAAGPRSGWAG